MLTLAYMPSDFHPLLLVLGETGDIAGLADCLADFARHPVETDLAEALGARISGAQVMLRPSTEDAGLAAETPRAARLIWTLSPATAAAFAQEVTRLAADPAAAGSVTLEVGRLGEIRVRVSRGEWEDPVYGGPGASA